MSDLLPEGLKFLALGWWVSHVLFVWLISVWAYRKGRRDERNARLHGPGPGAPAAPPASGAGTPSESGPPPRS